MIPDDISSAVLEIQSWLGDPNMYYAGGCLQDRETQDYDVVVIGCDMCEADILHEFGDSTYFDDEQAFPSYPGETENPYFLIVTTYVDGVKVDFLFVKEYMGIYDALDRFPLSIQMQAMDVTSITFMYSGKYQSNPIVIYIRGKSEDKYRKYYPNVNFVSSDGDILLPIEKQPLPF